VRVPARLITDLTIALDQALTQLPRDTAARQQIHDFGARMVRESRRRTGERHAE